VLYAPSDYQSDEAFWRLARTIRTQSPEESKEKTQTDIEDLSTDSVTATPGRPAAPSEVVSDPRVEHFLAEELALNKLSSIYGDKFLPQKVFELRGRKYSVDGLISTGRQLTVFEIKYFPKLQTPLNGIGRTYSSFKEMFVRMDERTAPLAGFVVVIVTPISKDEQELLRMRLGEFTQRPGLSIVFEIFDFGELKKEYGIE
jgi:hypothetical protein